MALDSIGEKLPLSGGTEPPTTINGVSSIYSNSGGTETPLTNGGASSLYSSALTETSLINGVYSSGGSLGTPTLSRASPPSGSAAPFDVSGYPPEVVVTQAHQEYRLDFQIE